MITSKQDVAIILLAAGLGTRMKSRKAKVLHELLGRPIILYVVETAKQVAGDNVVLVVGHQADRVQKIVSADHRVRYAVQKEQLGTGHAVMTALPHLPSYTKQVIILYGDVPLLMPPTVSQLLDDHVAAQRDITLIGVEIDNPTGYGRLLLNENRKLLKIVEEADATAEEKQIKQINTGIYCVRKETLFNTLHHITTQNIQGELYLTDIVEIGNKSGLDVGVVFADGPEELMGVNTVEDLEAAKHIMRKRLSKRS